MLGVHGNGLTHLLWMPPTPQSAVIEMFFVGGFARDCKVFACPRARSRSDTTPQINGQHRIWESVTSQCGIMNTQQRLMSQRSTIPKACKSDLTIF